ncbi:MAG: DNA repair protein RecN [Candidatus Borkfalkiaceae bacterium]|nr:DNA repair protein RecN [Christensenellaceae bacterium]
MLSKLLIKNVALIDSAEIEFTDGLNVLSGETGSGKSVIIDSLNFVLGAKADKNFIRNGENECVVTAEFDEIGNSEIETVFEELDMDKEDSLIITRKFNKEGKSSIKINGNGATVGMLKKFTSKLVDVHGQSEHFYLLSSANQLELLDKICGNDILSAKEKLKSEYNELKAIESELDKLGGDESSRAIRLDVLNYQIKEIDGANLKEGEEAELLEKKQRIINMEKILTSLNSVKASFYDEGGISDILGNASKSLSLICSISEDYNSLYNRLESAYAELEDVASAAENLAADMDDEDLNIDDIEQRLDVIKNLKRKYGENVTEINNFLSEALEEKKKLENFDILAERLLNEKKVLKDAIYNKYVELSSIRRKAAVGFIDNVLTELKELGFASAKFDISFNEQPRFDECKFQSANGFDSIEFMFSANIGEPLKPLSDVISGGEISRFMLAIKAQTAKYNNLSTFVFDEIDAGISGNTARVVAEKFAKIASATQIIAITHLPQISSMADNNLLIEKGVIDGKTLTRVTGLKGDEVVNEIVRLVGGDKNSDNARNHALELIKKSSEYKKSLKNSN